MADKRLKKMIREAADMAKLVPDELREAAFNRAFDVLQREHEARVRRAHADGTMSDEERTAWLELLEKSTTGRVVEKSLDILSVAANTVGIDGLSAEEITDALNERFGMNVAYDMVSIALDGADSVVDRVYSSGRTIYRLIPGLGGVCDDEGEAAPEAAAGDGNKSSKKRPSDGKASSGQKKKAQAHPRPTEILTDLVRKGFFSSARTATDILAYLQRRGIEFTTRELTPALIRLLQAGLLDRSKNPEGKFEYFRAR